MSDAKMEAAKAALKAEREKSAKEKKNMNENIISTVENPAPAPAATLPAPTFIRQCGMTTLQAVENTDALQKLGQIYAASGFFGAVTQSTATACVINAALEGISPLEYRAKYHTFEDGTTSVKSDYIQREFHRLGGTWKFNEWTAEVCDMTFTFQGSELRARVTLDEFKANGVAMGSKGMKTNWKKFPREMLKARCMATNIRALCPEALGGMYTQEEVQDFDRTPSAPREVKPTVVSPSPVAPTPAPKAEVIVPEVVEPEVVDYGVCPCGRAKGKRFEDLPTETLEKIMSADRARFAAVTDGHRDRIAAILAEREEEQG